MTAYSAVKLKSTAKSTVFLATRSAVSGRSVEKELLKVLWFAFWKQSTILDLSEQRHAQAQRCSRYLDFQGVTLDRKVGAEMPPP